ncbi:Cobalt-zinc-cadmium resistance protein czcD [Roseomonas mucosa]|jgi:cation diffusion facilitator family transporter|uniref:Cation-efflux pump n=1 Tax=Roseomonas mucosa TaxID=207340 RepID=A0A1S8D0F9_9PROT|nr:MULTISPECIES: cation diffusion facilitator family transporter [Roseomonas]MBS5902052.1 cation transporter [Acetobacteraceae bacterium]MDT8261689.1 cation diffusion facilitator family transporter [Roseomonas sp. DSM 102946]ATR21156.1 cation transporter [Roseomonas sp. FDAARGOS_362]AWV22260.1 Cobalt-zinc-cadmium resistance protein czcD [Roseomonas mucosa]MCG7352330.1 cation diffusion facilitator family transporter [Roseomonas mucosa]
MSLSLTERTAWTSLAVGLFVLSLKGVAWWITGSTAFFAEMLETVVNVAAASAALMAVRYSAMPADDNHPYGHAKAEYFSAVLEGALIVVAATLILQEVWTAWQNPRAPDRPMIGLVLSIAAALVNVVWATILRRRGKRLGSPALVADSHYLMADVVTSVGVVIGVFLVTVTGLLWLDPLMAGVTAVMILFSGLRLLRESVGGLMDEAAPPELVAQIREHVSANATGALEAHDLRTRRAGRFTFIDFHLVVPGGMSVDEAHGICDRIEGTLKQELGNVVISIHVEPDGKAKHSGVVVL